MKYVQAKLQHERTSDISMEMLIFTEGAQIFGVVEGVSVSPDGCKLAFSHYPFITTSKTGGKEYRSLKFVDLCINDTE